MLVTSTEFPLTGTTTSSPPPPPSQEPMPQPPPSSEGASSVLEFLLYNFTNMLYVFYSERMSICLFVCLLTSLKSMHKVLERIYAIPYVFSFDVFCDDKAIFSWLG